MSYRHIRDGTPKARKEYRCFLCDMIIKKRETYVNRIGADDTVFSHKMHTLCCAIADHLYAEEDWECHDDHQFRTELLGESK